MEPDSDPVSSSLGSMLIGWMLIGIDSLDWSYTISAAIDWLPVMGTGCSSSDSMVMSSLLFTVSLAPLTSILSTEFSTEDVASDGGGVGASVGSVEVVEDEDREGGGYTSTCWSVVEGAYPLVDVAAGITVVGKFLFWVLPSVSEKKSQLLC